MIDTFSRTWRELLGAKSLAPTANFFDSGGDSLGALRLCEALKRELQTDLSLMDIFQYPTVRQLTQALARRMAGPQAPAVELSRAALRRTMTSRRRRTTSN